MLVTALGGDGPRAIHERRLMPHMLPMTAGQIGYPVPLFVLMIPDDGLIHDTQQVGVTTVIKS